MSDLRLHAAWLQRADFIIKDKKTAHKDDSPPARQGSQKAKQAAGAACFAFFEITEE
jgi:hypothetical protein